MTKKLLLISLILLGLTQISFAQSNPSTAKRKISAELAVNTYSLFPVQYFEDSFNTMSIEKSSEMEKEFSESLLKKLDASKLTAEEKESVKPRILEFSSRISQMMKDLILKDFKVKDQTYKSLQNHYSTIFTLAELQKLNKFFKTSDGKQFVQVFNQLVTGEMNGKTGNTKVDEEKEFERLTKSLGNKLLAKFTDSLVDKVMLDIDKYIDEWSVRVGKDIEKATQSGAIKKEMDKFLAENFTK
jgi:hypothetical protein